MTDPTILWVLGKPYAPHSTDDTAMRWVLGTPYPPALYEPEEPVAYKPSSNIVSLMTPMVVNRLI